MNNNIEKGFKINIKVFYEICNNNYSSIIIIHYIYISSSLFINNFNFQLNINNRYNYIVYINSKLEFYNN